ncbi:MAG: hypothetical protein E4H08_08520 [Candidatus Atribacteria bacterium]|nr:MAG: hypothetical protein E4H08_08520 [Candidatus Atribacteria bacterium]
MRSRRVMILVVVLVVLGMVGLQTMGENDTEPSDTMARMALIPSGSFLMGDALAEGCGDERPQHSVTLSSYYIGRYEVTNDEMVRALQWAYENDRITVSEDGPENAFGDPRTLLHMTEAQCRITWNRGVFSIKDAKGSGYPCVEVSWYGAVAFCNFLSEMEGLTPCYDFDDWTCDWTANGYRLPTDAEWERAARGGAEGQRFPWSDTDTIDQSRANYKSNTDLAYDVNTTSGHHPDYAVGEFPYTSPVGSFPPNAYGLYDTAGNVWEWCWDYWDENYYTDKPMTNPHGPTTGSYRVVRSGRWGYDAASSRVSGRRHGWPPSRLRMGFRIARPGEATAADASLNSGTGV